jgi:hypothetical protein
MAILYVLLQHYRLTVSILSASALSVSRRRDTINGIVLVTLLEEN